VASHNLIAVDENLRQASEPLKNELKGISDERARRVLRFQAGEVNRYYFRTWELVELVLGVALAVTLLFGTNGNRFIMVLCAAMLVVVLVQHLAITPRLIEVGRTLDFADAGEMRTERTVHRGMHQAYAILEVGKIACGLVLGGRLLFFRSTGSRRRRSRGQVDPVDHSDHGHVNG
jgi:hypothetical protein